MYIIFSTKNSNCSVYIGDNSYYDSTNTYEILSITRTCGNTTRAYISFIRGSNVVVRMEFLERFGTTYKFFFVYLKI